MGKKQRAKQKRKADEKKFARPKASTADPNDLFDNPMSRAALAALSDEDKQKYKEIGKELYGHINFENGQALNNMPPPMAEAVAYLETQINAGMHISVLEPHEKEIMNDAYGEDWFEKWGYVEKDLMEICTVNPVRK